MKSFNDKVVVITGGSSGIGKATAKSFHDAGAKVVILGRDQAKLQKTAEEISENIMTVSGDVSKLTDLDRLYELVNERFGKIDALVVNAGIAGGLVVDQVDETHFDEIINVNLKGAYFTVQKSVAYLNQNASIVLISSMACHGGWKELSVYSAAKAGVSALAKSFSADLMHRGIRVNSILPGFTDTPIFEDRSVIPKASELVPNKRFATPDEIADAVMFLMNNKYVVGIDLLIDGGISTLRPEFR